MTNHAFHFGRVAVAAACALSLCGAAITTPAWADTNAAAGASNQTQADAVQLVTGEANSSTQDSTGASSDTDTDTDTGTDTNTDTDTDTDTVAKYSAKVIMLKGRTESVSFIKAAGTVKCSSSNKKVVKATAQGKRKFKLKALKNGSATVTFSSSKILCKYKITVASGNAFVNKWVKNVANQIKSLTKDAKEQLLLGSQYIVSNFTYANVYDLKTVISKRKGNCNSAGQVLVKIYKALGYKAQVRSAIHDKMSRYPSGITFGSNHYNVKVKAKGKTYYLDATPATGFVYLSTSKKPLAEYMYLGGSWVRVL